MKDHTGVATKQFADVFMELKHPLERLENVALSVGMDTRDLRRIVVKPNYEFTGLDTADRLLLAIGENITALSFSGDLAVIPANETTAAIRMAKDVLWAESGAWDDEDEAFTEDEVAAKAQELADLRREVISSHTEVE